MIYDICFYSTQTNPRRFLPTVNSYGGVPGSFFVGGLTPLLVYRAELPPSRGGTPLVYRAELPPLGGLTPAAKDAF